MATSLRTDFKKGLLYALAAIPMAAMSITYYVYLPKYYIDGLKVSAFWFGLIITFVRLIDAFVDPYVGKKMDIWSRHRQSIILFSCLPMAGFYLILSNEIAANLWIFLFCSFGFFISWSFVSVPYQSFGFSLTTDHHRRTLILGLREIFLVVGTVLATLLPFLIIELNDLPSDDFSFVKLVAVLYAVMLIFGCLIIKFCFKPKDAVKTDEQIPLKFFLDYKPVKKLLITYILTSFGSTLSGSLILFYIPTVLDSDRQNEFVFYYFVSCLLFAPAWIWLSKKFGKINAWLAAIIIGTFAFMAVLPLGAGDENLFLIVILFSSIGLGGALVIPASLQADYAANLTEESGQEVESQLVGYCSIAKKISAAVAAGIAFPLLKLSGYESGVDSNESVKNYLTFLYAGVPIIFYLLTAYQIFLIRRAEND